MKRAFTLIELVVAVGLLAMMLVFAGGIFKASIGAQRTAGANADIMQKFRAITQQLNADFKGLRKDAPMGIVFVKDAAGLRSDRIAFLSNGDFQSVRLYKYKKSDDTVAIKTVAGNVAAILYSPTANNQTILARKQKILTVDPTLLDSPILPDPIEFIIDSLATWKVRPAKLYLVQWLAPPILDPRLEEHIPMYAADGVSNFTIQLAAYDANGLTWPPANTDFVPPLDTDGDGIFIFSFNLYNPDSLTIPDHYYSASLPRSLKFTFTLYDSKGILNRPQTFTHIVYLDD